MEIHGFAGVFWELSSWTLAFCDVANNGWPRFREGPSPRNFRILIHPAGRTRSSHPEAPHRHMGPSRLFQEVLEFELDFNAKSFLEPTLSKAQTSMDE